MSFDFVEENAASRRRLEDVVARLVPEDFALSTPAGWSVTALLAHLACWDNRVLVLLRRWKAKGVDESPVDSEAMNDALKPLFTALEPKVAARLCLSSAQAVDAELETITLDLIREIEASSTHLRLNRALHRNDHLDEIETLLDSQRP